MNVGSRSAWARLNGSSRLLAGLSLAVMGCVLVWKVSIFVDRAYWAVLNPRELDYGEGIVWQQMRMIADGRGYAPLKSFPAIVFHYPPIYHALTWALASLSGVGDLIAGRSLSIASTLGAVVLIGVITALATTGSSRAARWTCGVTATLVSLTCAPVAIWAVFMRVDMVAVLLTLGGLWLAMLAVQRPRLIYPAAIAFVGAVFTKQTMVAAPGAAFLVLLVFRPRLAVRGVAVCIVLGLAVLGALSAVTHGEFTRHIFGYNINRFELRRLRGIGHWGRPHVLYLIAAAGGVWMSIRRLMAETTSRSLADTRVSLGARPEAIWLLIAVAYLVATTASLILVGKVGSGINYFVEWFLAGSVFVGVCVRQAADAVFPLDTERSGRAAPVNVFLLAPLLVIAGTLMGPTVGRVEAINTDEGRRQIVDLTRWIAASKRPVISDNMVIVREAGKEVVLEPQIVTELTYTGFYDERPLVALIRQHAFGFFVTVGGRGDFIFDQRYTPAVASAIYEAYPRTQTMAGFTVHLPPATAGN